MHSALRTKKQMRINLVIDICEILATIAGIITIIHFR